MSDRDPSLPSIIPQLAELAGECAARSRRLVRIFDAFRADALGQYGGLPIRNGDRLRCYSQITSELRDDVKSLVEELTRRDLARLRSDPEQADERAAEMSIVQMAKADTAAEVSRVRSRTRAAAKREGSRP